MSSVIINVGQCGNQLGQALIHRLVQDKASVEHHVYVSGQGKARSVHIDSEPKVIQHLLKNDDNGILRKSNVIQGRRGRGANWAMGYHGTKFEDDDRILDLAIDAIRKEIERCECFSGLIFIHSLCGGTGSGLGSRLIETLRDEYPLSYMLSCVVAPHVSGESPLQQYNALLCHAWLQRYVDGILFFENDEVLSRLEKRIKIRSGEKGVSLDKINSHIAACIGGAILPTDTLTPKRINIGMEPWEMIRSVSPNPSWKYMHSNTISKGKLTWDALAASLFLNANKYGADGKPHSCISSLIVARGDPTGSFPAYQATVEGKLRQAYNCVSWNPFPVDCWTSHVNTIGPKLTSNMTVIANTSRVIDHLTYVREQAQVKLHAKAYLHWYSKYGIEMSDFEEAFETLQDIVVGYTEAVR